MGGKISWFVKNPNSEGKIKVYDFSLEHIGKVAENIGKAIREATLKWRCDDIHLRILMPHYFRIGIEKYIINKGMYYGSNFFKNMPDHYANLFRLSRKDIINFESPDNNVYIFPLEWNPAEKETCIKIPVLP